MNQLHIHGGHRLCGEIAISGAKNAALPILCASLLTADPLYLCNVPDLNDISTMLKLLHQTGVNIEKIDHHKFMLQGHAVHRLEAPYDLVKTMRASILVLGPLLTRFGEVRVSLPGGCAIGSRPVDQHIKGLTTMGAEITLEAGYIHARAKRLKGARIFTDMITVTGTENLLMAATLAEGKTIIENAACEPEVTDLANLLVAMGARINGIGTNKLTIQGVDTLHGTTHTIVPDRIETGTFLCAVAAVGGDVTLTHTSHLLLSTILEKLREMGMIITTNDHWIRAQMSTRPKAVSLRTTEYPGFATDMQAQFIAINTIAKGIAHVTETIFENRFMHVQELNRLGASIEIQGNTAIIHGVNQLIGAPVIATDLRASASLVIAGLVAQGTTCIDRIYHLNRGYEHLAKKLRALGAQITHPV